MRAVPTLALALGLAACSRSHEPSSDQRIPVQRGDEIVGRIPIASTDLWRWCEKDVTAVIARSSTQFVHGLCVTRHDHQFALSRAPDGSALATLYYTRDGAELARARPVTAIEVVTEPAVEPSRALTLTVSGRAPITLDNAALHALQVSRGKRAGVPLAALLARAGVSTPRRITIRGATDYQVDPAWLDEPTRTLSLRRNNRGELRFVDEVDGGARSRVSAVTEIAIDGD